MKSPTTGEPVVIVIAPDATTAPARYVDGADGRRYYIGVYGQSQLVIDHSGRYETNRKARRRAEAEERRRQS